MKITKKKVFVLFAILILIFIFAFFAYVYYSIKNMFKLDEETVQKYINEVTEYLNNKYEEDMVIYDYSYYETFSAYVYPRNNSEIRFRVTGWINEDVVVYKDNYVESYLCYTAQKKIEPILNMYYKDYELTENLHLLPPGLASEYFYNKYKDIQLPINWDNPRCEEFFDELIVEVYDSKSVTEKEKEEITEKIKKTNVKFNDLIIKNSVKDKVDEKES